MNFKHWAASFFSWQDKTDPKDLESHELAYDAGKRDFKKEVLDVLKKHTFNMCDTDLQRDAEKAIDLEAVKEIEKL